MTYIGENYTAARRNVEDIIKQILPFVNKDLIQYFCSIIATGCSNIFNTNCLQENFLWYWEAGNNPSISKKLDNIMKIMNKGECNIFVISLDLYNTYSYSTTGIGVMVWAVVLISTLILNTFTLFIVTANCCWMIIFCRCRFELCLLFDKLVKIDLIADFVSLLF